MTRREGAGDGRGRATLRDRPRAAPALTPVRDQTSLREGATGHDIVVIGASAGGIQALLEVIGGLPADLPAALFVVVHTPATARSTLPTLLQRAGPLPAMHVQGGEDIVPGRIYVAPPDYHLLLRPGWVELSHGPRENHTRPAVDPLFRSAARAYGRRVVGIILSGGLSDGATGLMAVKGHGGVAIVQDPAEATVAGMPRSALELVAVDRVLPAAAIATELTRLARDPAAAVGEGPMPDDLDHAHRTIGDDFREQAQDRRADELTLYSCPDCGGSLWQLGAGPTLRFRCHVGHAWGPETLLGQKSEQLEAVLWASVRLLKERATQTRHLATRTEARGKSDQAERIGERAELDKTHAEAIRDLLEAMPDPLLRIGANGDEARMD